MGQLHNITLPQLCTPRGKFHILIPRFCEIHLLSSHDPRLVYKTKHVNATETPSIYILSCLFRASNKGTSELFVQTITGDALLMLASESHPQ
eukprot:scaffold175_cov177-Amphora_coffeaeformis.AAC.27